MRLNDFLSEYGNTSNNDYQKPVLGLIQAATRALNAYADNAGKPELTYTVTNNGWNISPDEMYRLVEDAKMQKGKD